MNKLINFLEIISNDQSPDEILNTEISTLKIIIIIGIFFTIIAISILIASAGNKSKKIYKLGISFLITPAIIATIIFLFQLDLTLDSEFQDTKKIQLTENKDYNITINENLNDYTIIINAKRHISLFEYNYIFYDKNKNIVNANSEYIEEIERESYKNIIIKKPTQLILSEAGKFQFEYKAYYYKETYLKDKLIALSIISAISYCISFGISQCIHTPYDSNNKITSKEE